MITFLVPTDFSINAQRASAYAVKLARQLGARVTLMHVYEEPVAISEYELSTIHFDTMKEPLLTRMMARPAPLHREFGNMVPIECVAYNKDLVGHIKKAFDQKEAALVIIGLTGSGMINFFMGSNTLNIVNNSSYPVLTVPPYVTLQQIRKIVFACDMHDVANTVPVEKIKKVIQLVHAELLVLNISRRVGSTASRENAAEKMEEEKQQLFGMLKGIPFTFHCISKRNIIAGIKDFVREQEADVIIIVPKKHDFPESIVRINHTKQMLFRSSVPILTLPPD